MENANAFPERLPCLPASVTIDPVRYMDWIFAFWRGHLDEWPSTEEIMTHYWAYVELSEMGEQEAGKDALRGVLPDSVVFYPEWMPRPIRRCLPRWVAKRWMQTPNWVGVR